MKSTNTPVTSKYEWVPITRITDYVYLGSYNDAISINKYCTKFRYIINMSMVKYSVKDPNITIINIPIPDNDTVDISKYFDTIARFLEKCEKSALPVLVHCLAGINRSGAMIMAYLLHTRDKSIPGVIYFLYIYHGLKESRGAFLENTWFKSQLIDHYL